MTVEGRTQTVSSNWTDLRSTLHTFLLGSNQGRQHWVNLAGLGLGLFGVTFLAYELGIFFYSGGVVFVPIHATIVGGIAAFWTGYSHNGLVVGWALTYMSFLGMDAEGATDASARSLIDLVAAVVEPEGLIYLGILGLAVAVIGFTTGAMTETAIRKRLTN